MPTTQTKPFFQLPESLPHDLEQFREEVERFTRGESTAAQFKAFRVPQGVYEQRESDTYMLRVRFPAGGVLPHQMRMLAHVSREYGNGILHVTTRQDIQVHRVLLGDIHPALVELASAGLSTKGGGGNTVRNVTGCYDAGVCPDEAFDVTPYAVAVTEALLPDPLSFQLPRKYKLAFCGCPKDCAGATVNDLGFIARRQDGAKGFAVYVGGGMGSNSRVADLLEPFVPAGEIHRVAEAVKRVFDKHGNRKNRNKARLRFLMEKIGLDEFRKLYEAELASVRGELAELEVRPLPEPDPTVPEALAEPADRFDLWRQRNVVPQRQDGFHMVRILTHLGDVPADTMDRLADVVERYGEGMARTTQEQDLVLRWVHENVLAGLHRNLAGLDRAEADPPVLRNLVSCAGASTCRLGICLSRGLAGAIREEITSDGLDLDELGNLRIHISGCPNSCGRHAIADVGLFGAARRVRGRLMPHYVLQLGGRVGEGRTRLGEGKQALPARSVPKAVAELLQAFRASPEWPDYGRFVDARGAEVVEELLAKYGERGDREPDASYFFDWGADEEFSLAGRGPGECSAGVFDLIEVDLASAREAAAAGRLYDAAVLASRSLLVTKGELAQSEAEALDLFSRHFLDEKLVDGRFRAVVDRAREAASVPQPADAFDADPAEVSKLVDTVGQLYDSMDPSLRFKPVTVPEPPAASAAPMPSPDRESDFRGVVCPLNFVKTKMVLGQMQSGDVLSILLDDQGAKNVPDSVRQEGHEVLAVAEKPDHWRVLVRKA